MFRLSYVEIGKIRDSKNRLYKNFNSKDEIIEYLYENIKYIDIYTFEIEEID